MRATQPVCDICRHIAPCLILGGPARLGSARRLGHRDCTMHDCLARQCLSAPCLVLQAPTSFIVHACTLSPNPCPTGWWLCRCAIVLLDQAWQDPDRDIADGVDERSQTSLLRLDSMLMRTHLNLRKLLEVCPGPLPAAGNSRQASAAMPLCRASQQCCPIATVMPKMPGDLVMA